MTSLELGNHRPLFSVVIPVWKRVELARRAVRSVLSQTFSDFEILIVDDASPHSVADAIGLRPDDRIRHIRRSVNGGGSAARNTGIDAARGHHIALLDSDDEWLPHKLAREAEWIAGWRGDGRWMLFSRFWVRTVTGTALSREIRWDPQCDVGEFLFADRGPMQTSSLVLPAAFARGVRFDERLRRLQDWDFVLRVARAKARIEHIPDATAIYDAPERADRISAHLDPDFLLEWISERRDNLSERAYAGFLANKLAPELVQVGRRMDALPMVLQGLQSGAMRPRHALVEFLRIGTPTRVFTRLTSIRRRIRDLNAQAR